MVTRLLIEDTHTKNYSSSGSQRGADFAYVPVYVWWQGSAWTRCGAAMGGLFISGGGWERRGIGEGKEKTEFFRRGIKWAT